MTPLPQPISTVGDPSADSSGGVRDGASGGARWRHGFHRLRVKRVVQETADTRSFVLDVPADLQDLFRYRAGQFCTFRVRVGEDRDEHLRSYSMSSAPEVDDELTVTVKRVPGGAVSNWLNDHVAEGDALDVTPPAGVFCVRGESRGPVVAFCGGSGITPVISIAKSVLATGDRPVRLLYANRDRDSVIFDRELRSLRDAHPDRLELRHHLDADTGYLDREAIAGFAAGHLDGDFYICGPTPFMDLVETTLHDLGVTPDQILIERFVTPGDPALPAAPEPARPRGSEDADADEAEVTETVVLILGGKKTRIPYHQGDTVLGTARRGGLQPPFSCEAGNCATCMALLREGHVTMRVNDALTDDEVAEGWVLTCQSLPHGRTVTIDYDAV